jgi:acyl-CoA synthetase (AMP-forming)/AMP-acid ligase II
VPVSEGSQLQHSPNYSSNALIEWSLADVHRCIADAVPDREMLVWRDQRRTYAEVNSRSDALAHHLVGAGLGIRRERSAMERWESGQSQVGILMFNRPEYIETMIGGFKARTSAFNINHHYAVKEVTDLLTMMGAEAVIYQQRLGPLLRDALASRSLLLIEVPDETGVDSLPGCLNYEEIVTAALPASELPSASPDDLYTLCTGGTTGRPKGVLWRQGDIFVAGMAGGEPLSPAQLQERVRGPQETWMGASPLMHAAAQWTVFSGLHSGARVVLHDDSKRFDAATILATAERERVNMMSIIGDAFARPMVAELGRRRYDLSALHRLGTGGAFTSFDLKTALLEALPHLTVMDGYGSSETGGMAFGAMTKAGGGTTFMPGLGAVIVAEDRSHFLRPEETEVGWTARRGRIPLGYLNDPAATEKTFPMVGGERVSLPGDRAQYVNGQIKVLGRDSLVVNTGGEKVFVEEVEEAVCRHPEVVDALVLGRPSERFGQEVVAIVETNAEVSLEELREFCSADLARFKLPRALIAVDSISRHASGKADYAWARGVVQHSLEGATT